MPKLIDADEMRRALHSGLYVQTTAMTEAVALLGELIDAAPTIDPGAQIRWVPCAEQMPDGPGPYLYTSARGVVGMGTPALIKGRAKIGEIIAWAELPEPYKEDKPDE